MDNSANLKASQISGHNVGSYSNLRATEKVVALSGTLGTNCSLRNADSTTYPRNTHHSFSGDFEHTRAITLHNIGCGIYFDAKDKSYLIPDRLIDIHGDAYLKLFQNLVDLEYTIQKDVVKEKGSENPAHRVTSHGTRASTEVLRNLVREYIQKNDQRRERG